jgi:hypothetical protein
VAGSCPHPIKERGQSAPLPLGKRRSVSHQRGDDGVDGQGAIIVRVRRTLRRDATLPSGCEPRGEPGVNVVCLVAEVTTSTQRRRPRARSSPSVQRRYRYLESPGKLTSGDELADYQVRVMHGDPKAKRSYRFRYGRAPQARPEDQEGVLTSLCQSRPTRQHYPTTLVDCQQRSACRGTRDSNHMAWNNAVLRRAVAMPSHPISTMSGLKTRAPRLFGRTPTVTNTSKIARHRSMSSSGVLRSFASMSVLRSGRCVARLQRARRGHGLLDLAGSSDPTASLRPRGRAWRSEADHVLRLGTARARLLAPGRVDKQWRHEWRWRPASTTTPTGDLLQHYPGA